MSKFDHKWSAEVVRCFACGQPDEPDLHNNARCPAFAAEKTDLQAFDERVRRKVTRRLLNREI